MVNSSEEYSTHRAASNESKSIKSDLIGPRYRPLNIENPAIFWNKKAYTNDSSFERARRAESNDTKITLIYQVLTKL